MTEVIRVRLADGSEKIYGNRKLVMIGLPGQICSLDVPKPYRLVLSSQGMKLQTIIK